MYLDIPIPKKEQIGQRRITPTLCDVTDVILQMIVDDGAVVGGGGLTRYVDVEGFPALDGVSR